VLSPFASARGLELQGNATSCSSKAIAIHRTDNDFGAVLEDSRLGCRQYCDSNLVDRSDSHLTVAVDF
jgi:hypothetical protein